MKSVLRDQPGMLSPTFRSLNWMLMAIVLSPQSGPHPRPFSRVHSRWSLPGEGRLGIVGSADTAGSGTSRCSTEARAAPFHSSPFTLHSSLVPYSRLDAALHQLALLVVPLRLVVGEEREAEAGGAL